MKFQFFSINAMDSQPGQELLNQFLASHSVGALEKQFVSAGANSFWSICIEYVEGTSRVTPRKEKVDYKEVLNDTDFTVYSKLRNLRKTVADKEGIPLYSVFTNEQLAGMVTGRTLTQTAMLAIPGIGKARVDKYGTDFLVALQRALGEGANETNTD